MGKDHSSFNAKRKNSRSRNLKKIILYVEGRNTEYSYLKQLKRANCKVEPVPVRGNGIGNCMDFVNTSIGKFNSLPKKEKEKYSKESMEIIKRSNEELREFKHDLKNYLLPLQEAMETMPQSEMVKVWKKINQKIEDVQTLIQTGNSYVDSMINTKITFARSEKVDVKCTILSKIEGIDDLEFCTVFGNLMDNAIEAERKVTEKKEIIIFVEEKMGYLRLEIQNKIEKSVLNENSSLNTTKKDTSSHGIGHKSVKRTMEKVGGALKYYETGDLFCAEAVFPIK